MKLDQKIPPLVLVVICTAFMYISEQSFTSLNISTPWSSIGFILFSLLGFFIALSGVLSFKRHKTTVNPVNSKNVSTLVNSGIFKHTRNPMYVGMLSFLIGYMIYLANPLNISLIIIFILYLNKYQIIPEEKLLEKLFGNDYLNYKSSVRRWL